MKIQRATFIGVRGVPDLTLELTDGRTGVPHTLVAFTGPGASGKTRMIEALLAAKEAIGPYGPMAVAAPWLTDGKAAKVLVSFHLDDGEREFAGITAYTLDAEITFGSERVTCQADEGLRDVLQRYTHDPAKGKVEYFPASRRIPMFPPFAGLSTGEQRLARVSFEAKKYGCVLTFLRTLENDPPRREAFAARLAALSPTCRYVRDPSGGAMPLCLTSRGGSPVSPGDISSGEADAVIFAATATIIGLGSSVVFVDRPDLHTDDLERLVTGLASLGPGNQVFVAGQASLAAAVAAAGGHVVTLKTA